MAIFAPNEMLPSSATLLHNDPITIRKILLAEDPFKDYIWWPIKFSVSEDNMLFKVLFTQDYCICCATICNNRASYKRPLIWYLSILTAPKHLIISTKTLYFVLFNIYVITSHMFPQIWATYSSIPTAGPPTGSPHLLGQSWKYQLALCKVEFEQ